MEAPDRYVWDVVHSDEADAKAHILELRLGLRQYVTAGAAPFRPLRSKEVGDGADVAEKAGGLECFGLLGNGKRIVEFFVVDVEDHVLVVPE